MDEDFKLVQDAIAQLLINSDIQLIIDRNLDNADAIGKDLRQYIQSAIASQFPTLNVCFNRVCITPIGVIDVDFEIAGETPPPKLFLIYDTTSLYDGNHHYHSQGE